MYKYLIYFFYFLIALYSSSSLSYLLLTAKQDPFSIQGHIQLFVSVYASFSSS